MAEPRWRDIAGAVGVMAPGPRNSITDVPGVAVGHAQAASGERTGVSVVVPPRLPTPAGTSTVNGTGELTGKLEVDEVGEIETPVYLCGTHALGTVYQAAIVASGRGPDNVVIPVVGECDDGELADSRTVVAADVERALAAAGPDVAEGSVGAGTGMQCFGYPGGIGTASRVVGAYHVGVLLLCNFGEREYLDLLGHRLEPEGTPTPDGSCIAICATDAPLSAHQVRRLSLRPLLGLARAGSYGSRWSGEIALALATTGEVPAVPNEALNPFFAAAYEAAHEAVLNCLVAATPARKRDGSEQEAFPIELARRLAAERGVRDPA